jgi:hypothetical protein
VALTLVGRGGHFIASVPRDTKIQKGEEVLLRSNQLYRLGVVKEISNNNQDISWYVFVENDYNQVSSLYLYVRKQ